MRTLIDGYNVMYAAGLLGRRLGPDGFRRARHRFLNDLAAALGPVEAHQTTVVFDASAPPEGRPSATSHKGIAVVFAVGDQNADERIEHLIARHPAPKTLTVVSSDLRVRQAAARKRATVVTADDFLAQLDTRRRRRPAPESHPSPDADRSRPEGLSAEESAAWLAVFGHLDDDPEVRDHLPAAPAMLTDADIACIEREVEEETRSTSHRARPRGR